MSWMISSTPCCRRKPGARAADAPAGWAGSVGDLQAISLESLEIMDAARRQAGVVFPSDKQDQ